MYFKHAGMMAQMSCAKTCLFHVHVVAAHTCCSTPPLAGGETLPICSPFISRAAVLPPVWSCACVAAVCSSHCEPTTPCIHSPCKHGPRYFTHPPAQDDVRDWRGCSCPSGFGVETSGHCMHPGAFSLCMHSSSCADVKYQQLNHTFKVGH